MATRRQALIFDIAVSSSTKDDLEQLEKDLLAVNEQIKEARKSGDQDLYASLKTQQSALRQELKDTRAEIRNQIRDFRQAQFPTDSLEGLRLAYREVRQEVNRMSQTDPRFEERQAEARRLKDEIKVLAASFGDTRDNVGNYQEAIENALQATQGLISGSVGPLLAGLGIGGALATGFEVISDGAQVLEEITFRFIELRGEIQRLTNISGPELGTLASQVDALANTFNKDTDEILRAANALSQNFDIGFGDSLQLIESGFLAGADAGGELLDNIREYPAFFKEARIDAESFIGLITRQTQEGLFSDKGIDAIKEAAISLRELTPATQEALEGIGITGQEIQAAIAEDGLGAAIELVAGQLQNFEADSREFGRVLADVFKGAGEDAGTEFILSLSNLRESVNDQVDASNELTAAQQRQLEAQRQLSQAQNDLSSELSELTTSYRVLGQEALAFVVRQIVTFVQAIRSIPEFVRENRVTIAGLTAALIGYNSAAIAARISTLATAAAQRLAAISTVSLTTATRALNVAFRANPIGFIVTAVGLLVTGLSLAYNRSERLRAAVAGLTAFGRELFEVFREAFSNFSEGFDQIRQGNIRQGLAAIGRGLVESNPLNIALTEGRRLAGAFNEGYTEKLEQDRKDAREEEALKSRMDSLGKNTEGSAQNAGAKIGDAFGQGLDSAMANTIDQLKRRKADLEAELANTEIGTDRFNQIGDEIRSLDRQIEAATRGIDQQTLEVIERLSQRKGQLEKELNDLNFNPDRLAEIPQQIESIDQQIESLFEQIGRNAGNALNRNVNEGIKETIKVLQGQRDELNEQLNIGELNSAKFEAISAQLIEVNNNLADAYRGVRVNVRQTEQVVTISITGMRARLRQLQTELTQAPTNAGEDFFTERIEKINRLEKAIDDAEQKLEELTNRLTRVETPVLAPLQTTQTTDITVRSQTETDPGSAASIASNIEEDIRAIERRRDAEITAILQTAETREEVADQVRLLELNATNQILEAKLRAEDLSNAQRLQLARQLAENELQIEETKVNEKQRINERLAQTLTQAFGTIARGFIQIEASNSEREFSNRREALEEEYGRRIELAEGNNIEQERLRQELAVRQEQVDRDSARKRKDIARKEAIIQGALSAIEASPDPFRIALALTTTAINLAVIEAQQFAKGGKATHGQPGYVEINGIPVKGVPRLRPGLNTITPNIPRQANGDSILATIAPDETVLTSPQVQEIIKLAGSNVFKLAGVPGFQTGGFAGGTFTDGITPQVTNPNELVEREISVKLDQQSLMRQAELIARETAEQTAEAMTEAFLEAQRIERRNQRLRTNQNQ